MYCPLGFLWKCSTLIATQDLVLELLAIQPRLDKDPPSKERKYFRIRKVETQK
jgi:hypothetical protein